MSLASESFDELLYPQIIKPLFGKVVVQSPSGLSIDNQRKKANSPVHTASKQDQDQLDELKVKKAWDIATGPAKSVPMNLIMSYMTGNSLQVIPIMMTFMLFWNPLKAIFTETNSSFKNLETKKNSSDILLSKAVFVACQLGCMAVGIWKLYKMGLIPNSESDWLAWKEVVQYKETSILI